MIEQGTLLNFVGGSWQRADAADGIPVHNPATGEVLSTAPLSPSAAVARAVEAAQKALPAWRRTPPGDRIQPLFRLKALLDAQFSEVARLITQECGKTLGEAEGELRRGIENVEVATGIRR
jgi:malonate-semialdehyde dehydrogenase (acetylating)/methylmalonate-semialdehyde dehydrogenase